jgi:hypothetical protein
MTTPTHSHKASTDEGVTSGSRQSEPSALEKFIHVDSRLSQNRSECPLRQLPRMIWSGGIPLVDFAIPNLMGASGLLVKLESTTLLAFHYLAVAKSR